MEVFVVLSEVPHWGGGTLEHITMLVFGSEAEAEDYKDQQGKGTHTRL